MKMQPACISDGGKQGFLATILAVAENGAADRRAMDPQLMRPSGAWPQREQRRSLGQTIELPEVRQRLLSPVEGRLDTCRQNLCRTPSSKLPN